MKEGRKAKQKDVTMSVERVCKDFETHLEL
jgi:hypothetical protein